MRVRQFLAAAILLTALGGPAGAVASHTCNTDPDCNAGRGALPGYTCLRSEVNNTGNEFNGRVCRASADPSESWYVYARSLLNREWVVVCHNEERVASAPGSSTVDHCSYVTN